VAPEAYRDDYDEFGLFHENAAEFGLPFDAPPVVERRAVEVSAGRSLSALVWGSSAPELVLLHGGAQNAHTWDTVALALGRPLVAVDLPSHGHSDGSPYGSGAVEHHAADVAAALRALVPSALPLPVVGMSLGGLTALSLASRFPSVVSALALVDVTPGVNAEKAAPITAFVNGPASFDSFDDLLARTIEHNPTRTESSLRRGILHNAEQLEDGSWVWRYARFRQPEGGTAVVPDFAALWDALGSLDMPVLLVRGMAPGTVVDDDDEAEVLRRQPSARVARVEGAGHSVQGDRPLELAALLESFLSSLPPAGVADGR
jgi:pimeloyl-ACP methyl ester carboxylesterase